MKRHAFASSVGHSDICSALQFVVGNPKASARPPHSVVYSSAALSFQLRAILSVTITSFPAHA